MQSLKEKYGIVGEGLPVRAGHTKRSQVMIRDGFEVWSRRNHRKRQDAIGKTKVQGDYLLKTRQVRRQRWNQRNHRNKQNVKCVNSRRIHTVERHIDRSLKDATDHCEEIIA
jgi:hypothetical protein